MAYHALILSTAAGLSTLLGAVLVFFNKGKSKNPLYIAWICSRGYD